MNLLRSVQETFSQELLSEEPLASDNLLKLLKLKNPTQASSAVAIYKTTYRSALLSGLQGMYPVVERLVGEEFFEYLFACYHKAFRSHSQNIYDYGAYFSDFLSNFIPKEESLKGYQYLIDVARLENLFWRVAHLEPSLPFPLHEFSALPLELQERVLLVRDPTLQLFSSEFPVVSIWHENRKETPDPISVETGAQRAVVRSEETGTSVSTVFDCGIWKLLEELREPRSIKDLVSQFEEEITHLPLFIESGWITSYT